MRLVGRNPTAISFGLPESSSAPALVVARPAQRSLYTEGLPERINSYQQL